MKSFPGCQRELGGKVLVCHCLMDVECHADVLIEEFRVAFLRGSSQVIYGMPWIPLGIMREGKSLVHPFEDHTIDDSLKRCIAGNLRDGVDATARARLEALNHWQARADALAQAEAALHGNLDVEVGRVVQGKRILVFKECLRQ